LHTLGATHNRLHIQMCVQLTTFSQIVSSLCNRLCPHSRCMSLLQTVRAAHNLLHIQWCFCHTLRLRECGHNLLHSVDTICRTQSIACCSFFGLEGVDTICCNTHNLLHGADKICRTQCAAQCGHNLSHIICCTLHILRLGECGHNLLQHAQSVAYSFVLLWLSAHVCIKTVYCMTTLLHDNFTAALRDNLTTFLQNDFSA